MVGVFVEVRVLCGGWLGWLCVDKSEIMVIGVLSCRK